MEDINTILELKTVQIAPFRSIFTSLKEILVVTNICFTKDEMSIINMDKSRTIVVDCKLFAKEFEYYKCLEEKFVIGVKMSYLFRLISSLESDDTLTIFIDEKDYRDGVVEHLGLKFENGIKNQCKIHKLKLVDPDQEEYQFPDGLTYSSELSMPSSNFQKIIRDFIPLGDIIHLESVDDELRFTVLGKISDSKLIIRESDSPENIKKEESMFYKKKPDSRAEVISGKFNLKHLGYVIKCTNLCPQVDLLLDNEYPLTVHYDASSLGHVRFSLGKSKSV